MPDILDPRKSDALDIRCPHCRERAYYDSFYDCGYDFITCKHCSKEFRYDFSSGKDVISQE